MMVIAMLREPSYNVVGYRERKTYELGGENSLLMAIVIVEGIDWG